MDSKVMLAGFAAVLLVSIGLAFAAPNLARWPDLDNTTLHNMTGHCLVYDGEMPMAERHGMMQRGEWNGTPSAGFNATSRHPFASPNATAFAEFQQAIIDDDYSSAMGLHKEYGFGGRLFDILNQSTFDKFAHIEQLRQELAKELGMAEAMPGDRGFGLPEGRGFGPMRGRGVPRFDNSTTAS
ncbi:MAG: hypothetical protein V1881_03100 [Candidatus Micrarchaeota archaeon]